GRFGLWDTGDSSGAALGAALSVLPGTQRDRNCMLRVAGTQGRMWMTQRIRGPCCQERGFGTRPVVA
ncbi:MAG: hypothetical protein RLZZ413_2726, partial [Pseudomonadota bacterium]